MKIKNNKVLQQGGGGGAEGAYFNRKGNGISSEQTQRLRV